MSKSKIVKSFVLQHDQSDCGVACLLSLIRFYGGNNTIENLRELSGTSKQGTTLLGLYQVANQIGFDAEGCEADMKALISHKKPLILHLTLENKLQHFVVCYAFENGKFVIGDPAKGIVSYNKEELERRWLSKACLTLETNSTFKRKENIKQTKKKWFLNLLREDKDILLVSVFVGFIISVLGMVMAVFSQKLIDDILPSKDFQKLMLSIILVSILLVVRIGFVAVRKFLLLTQGKQFNNRIIEVFYNALLHLPKSFFDTRKKGDLVARLNDTVRIQKVITQLAGNYIIDSLIAITSIIFLFIYSWQTGLIAVFSMPFYFIILFKYNKRIISAQKKVMVSYAHSESNYISTLSGVAEIKNFNKQSFFAQLNKLIYGTFQNKIFELGKVNIRIGFIAGLIGVLFLSTVLVFNSYLVYTDKMLIGGLMAVFGISSTLLPSIGNLALIAIPLNEAKVAFNRMHEFAGLEPETLVCENISSIDFNEIMIKNIGFRFTGRRRILEDVTILLKKGELISVVGESGCGKSTLANIMQKFYSYESGKIIINNKLALEDIDTNNWRNILGVVPQDIHIFNGTIVENICLDNVNENVEKVLEFLNEYGFDQFINELPQGSLTLVGEEGINLSGGQKQMIALARALYKKPQILILDEATAAMDRKIERFTLDLLNKLKKNIAVLYISHRLHVLKDISDRTYIIENGKVQFVGSHSELMESENLYSSFWKELVN
ncbi:MAG: peptidase domain-containing ABC transporter [Bacteroidales bacterium]|nr:peptidase domain-containing ABC transporter [Bacteroidales bacterium]